MPELLDPAALDELRAMTGGDPALVDELLDTFRSDADASLAELEAAADAGDVPALVRPAHSLKSNALTVGATRLAELSRALELDAKADAVDSPSDRVAEIRDELGRVRPAVMAARSDADGE